MALSTTSIEFWTNIGIAVTSVISGAIVGVTYIRNKYKSMIGVEETIDVRSQDNLKHNSIHELLFALRFQMNADRAQIAQFHNGGKFLEGSPMKRFSVTHESCNPGISMEYLHLQGIVATIFWDMIEILKQDDPKIRLTRSLPKESALKTYNESKNIQAFALLPIKKQELYIGFVRVEWNDITVLPDNPEDANRIMDQYRSFIELEMVRRG